MCLDSYFVWFRTVYLFSYIWSYCWFKSTGAFNSCRIHLSPRSSFQETNWHYAFLIKRHNQHPTQMIKMGNISSQHSKQIQKLTLCGLFGNIEDVYCISAFLSKLWEECHRAWFSGCSEYETGISLDDGLTIQDKPSGKSVMTWFIDITNIV